MVDKWAARMGDVRSHPYVTCAEIGNAQDQQRAETAESKHRIKWIT